MKNKKDDKHELNREQYIKFLTYSRAFSTIYWIDLVLVITVKLYLTGSMGTIVWITLIIQTVFMFLVELVLALYYSGKNQVKTSN